MPDESVVNATIVFCRGYSLLNRYGSQPLTAVPSVNNTISGETKK